MEYQTLILGLCIIAWKDTMQKRIPNQILLIMLLIRVGFLLYEKTGVKTSLTGLLIGGGVMLLGYLLSKSTMGAGDVKLMAVVGCYVGSDRILQVALWSFTTAAGYSFMLLLRKKSGIQQGIPFAPFALIGTICTLLLESRGVLC